MLQIVYSTQEFKNQITNILSKLKNKNIKIQYIKFSEKFERITEILDDASGVIIEFNPNKIRKTIMLYLAARFIGIPILLVTNIEPKNTTGKLLIRTLKNTTILNINKETNTHNIKRNIQELFKKANTFEMPAKILNATNNYITINAKIDNTKYKVKIYYLRTKNLNKPPLFFIHGITARSAAYLTTLNVLKKYFNIIAIDLPYHGRSGIITPNPPDYDTFAQIIVHTIKDIYKKEKLEKYNTFYLMGHSLGGSLSFFAAQQLKKYNINITHLYLLNPAGGPIKESQAKLFYTTTIKKILNIKKYYVLRNNFKRILTEILINYLRAFEKRTTKQNFFMLIKQIPYGFKNFKNMHYNGSTSLIFSDQDQYFSSNYIIDYCQKFDCLNFKIAKGLHDWLIVEPMQVEKLLKNTLPTNASIAGINIKPATTITKAIQFIKNILASNKIQKK